MESLQEKLTQANLERDRLRERLEVVSEEKRAVVAEAQKAESKTVENLKDHLATLRCLQSEQASETEALKLALRSEQTLREKAETDYANLLETWQNFERNYQPPVDLGAEISNQHGDVSIGERSFQKVLRILQRPSFG